MSSDNTIETAKRALDEGTCDAVTHAAIQGLILAIESDEAAAAEMAVEKRRLAASSAAVNDRIAAAYEQLRALIPANPLGNMTIG